VSAACRLSGLTSWLLFSALTPDFVRAGGWVKDRAWPGFLTEAHAALIALPGPDQARLSVTEDWKHGPHQLTYRQVERTSCLVAKALCKDAPDGAPSQILARTCELNPLPPAATAGWRR
jgi:hypothetical protein